MNIVMMLSYCLVYLVFFGIAEVLFRRFNVNAEHTRKFVHVFTGIVALSFPFYLEQTIEVVGLCVLFFVMLIFIKKYNILPSIMQVDRRTYGSLFFPLAVGSCFYMFKQHDILAFYMIPVAILTISDPLASIVGQALGKGPYQVFGNKKTLSGSAAFLLSAILICLLINGLFSDISIPIMTLIVLSVFATLAESVSVSGTDNLSIPLISLAILYLSMQ